MPRAALHHGGCEMEKGESGKATWAYTIQSPRHAPWEWTWVHRMVTAICTGSLPSPSHFPLPN